MILYLLVFCIFHFLCIDICHANYLFMEKELHGAWQSQTTENRIVYRASVMSELEGVFAGFIIDFYPENCNHPIYSLLLLGDYFPDSNKKTQDLVGDIIVDKKSIFKMTYCFELKKDEAIFVNIKKVDDPARFIATIMDGQWINFKLATPDGIKTTVGFSLRGASSAILRIYEYCQIAASEKLKEKNKSKLHLRKQKI